MKSTSALQSSSRIISPNASRNHSRQQNRTQATQMLSERKREQMQNVLDTDRKIEDKKDQLLRNLNTGQRYLSPNTFSSQRNSNNCSPKNLQTKTQLRQITEKIFGQKPLYELKPPVTLKKFVQSPAYQRKHNFQFDDIYKNRVQSPTRFSYKKNQDQIALIDTNLDIFAKRDLSPRSLK